MRTIRKIFQRNMTKFIIFTLPIILSVDIYLFSLFTEMIRQPSDISVILGLVFISLFIAFNYFLFSFIKNKLKKNK